MKWIIGLLLLVPAISFAQVKENQLTILPKDVNARPFMDSDYNYLPDSLRPAVYAYIHSKSIYPQKLFIDKKISYEGDSTISIRIWDADFFLRLKQFEYKLKHHQNPAGVDPGFSGVIIIDRTTKHFLHFYVDQ